MRPVVVGCAAAAVCWFVMFSPWTTRYVNFWGVMVGATGLLSAYALLNSRGSLRELYAFAPKWFVVGTLSAALLYVVFLIGDRLSAMLFDFASVQVTGIYGTKTQASPAVIGALLVLWIGPAEEIFWRGFIQRRLSENYGVWKGYLFACAIYAAIHLWSFNLMLIVAALVCGLFWGWMFLRFKSVWPGLISHAIWDLTIFILLPIR